MSDGPYLLDTSVLINLSHNLAPAQTWMDARVDAGDELGVCAVWDISPAAARQAGGFRHDLARQGRAINLADALIAATAVEVGAAVVTNNVKDFPIAGLRLVRLGAAV